MELNAARAAVWAWWSFSQSLVPRHTVSRPRQVTTTCRSWRWILIAARVPTRSADVHPVRARNWYWIRRRWKRGGAG